MRGIRLGNQSVNVEHERVVGAGVVRLDLGQNRVEQIGVMNLRIENLRRRSAELTRDQLQAGLRVDRRLVFGEHDQCRTRLIQLAGPFRM